MRRGKMVNRSVICVVMTCCIMAAGSLMAADEGAPDAVKTAAKAVNDEGGYAVGVEDVLEIAVLQPEKLSTVNVVSPDGTITFPYIGTVQVRGRTLGAVQDIIQTRLSDGFMRYPVVSVSLRESHSRKFNVYGEVARPGTFPLEENATVLKGISIAGGLTKYGSSSRVKVLRPKKDGGYDNIKINIKAVMDGDATADIKIEPGDTIVVEEGVF